MVWFPPVCVPQLHGGESDGTQEKTSRQVDSGSMEIKNRALHLLKVQLLYYTAFFLKCDSSCSPQLHQLPTLLYKCKSYVLAD